MKSRRTILVACSGPDGAGKTTLALSAIAHLRSTGVEPSYHWMRLGSSRFLDLVKKAAPVRAETGSRDGGSAYKDVLARRSLLRRVWAWVLATDYMIRVWAKVARARIAGGVHVFDRYAVDAAVDLRLVYGLRGARRLVRLAPAPDVRVMVTAEGIDLSQRGDTPADPDVLERSLTLYREWSGYFTHRIDTASAPEDAGRELAGLILKARARA